jgi:hypothetical protein
MQASVFEIKRKIKTCELSMVTLDDFTLQPRGMVHAGIIIERPQISLYCLDDERRQAVFVETPPEADLARHPFYYQAQYEHAERVLVVSYAVLSQLAAQIEDRVLNLILIYSVGRCGSTLISRVLGRLDRVQSLSEPDVYSQIAAMRPKNGSRDSELTQLIRSCTRLLNKTGAPQTSALALKFRSFAIEIGDLFHTAFPRAKALFLYRNAETWASSAARAFHASPVAATAAMWVSAMDRYLDLHAQGVPMLAVQYEALTAFPAPTLRTIFEYCDLPIEEVNATGRIFDEDSQEGTSLARNRLQTRSFVMTSDHRSQIGQLLRQHPRIQTPGFIVPNTAAPAP